MHIRQKLGAVAVATTAVTFSIAAGSAAAAARPHSEHHHSRLNSAGGEGIATS